MANQPLQPVVTSWLEKIKLAEEHKRKNFGRDAEECHKFFAGPYSWMYRKRAGSGEDEATAMDWVEEGDIKAPTFQLTINKASEVVQLFGPALYQQNPDRKVSPRRDYQIPGEYFATQSDPMGAMQAQQIAMMGMVERSKGVTVSALYESLLNYLPTENNLDHESRLQIDDALIKGMGILWHEIVTHPDGLRVPASIFDSCDNLLLDPDATRIEDCMWVAKRCTHATWALEDEYGRPRGSIKGNRESFSETAGLDNFEDNARRARGQTNDQLVYYKIWSRMGIGGRLAGVVTGNEDYKGQLDQLGQYTYLAVARGLDWPLNLPEEVWNGTPEEVAQRCQWPIPFYLDRRNEWPFTHLSFHEDPGQLWPVAHLKSALGELKFINWVYSFLTGKIRTACRDVLVILKSLSDDVKRAITSGPDYSVVEIDALTKDIDQIVKFIQHPTFNPEIYHVLEHMIDLFEKRTGLTDLLYGESARQLRSAEEASIKQTNATIRPDDMSKCVEASQSLAARKEMAAARWILTDKDIGKVLGTEAAYIWQTEVMMQPPEAIFHQFDCRIESGSTKRPNRQQDAENLQNAMNNLLGPLFQYASATGNVEPINALIQSWAKSLNLEADKFLLAAPPPPPAAPAPGAAGGGAPPPGGPPPSGAQTPPPGPPMGAPM
jgi:hypothetical protein